MKRPVSWLLAAAFLALPVLAEEAKPKGTEAKKAMSQEEVMKAWMAYMTPGEPHKMMAKSVGTWTTKAKSWMEPGKPPEETEGTAEFSMILGGRYLLEKYNGTMMGQPFEGMGISAYDNYKKQHMVTWVDSAGTGIFSMSGTMDKDGKALTMNGSMLDPTTGKSTKTKGKMTFKGENEHLYEMWMTPAGGKTFKCMEIVYTRKI